MPQYELSDRLKKLYRCCYRLTFVLIGCYVIFILIFMFSMAKGWLTEDALILKVVTYSFGVSLLSCILIMAFYAVSYLCFLWKAGYRNKALEGLFVFVFLSLMAGYLWYRQAEVKGQQIDFKLH